ncbi:MAG: universal stress protein [Burkholderiales bacterium]
MRFKTILVHASDERRTMIRVELAALIAAKSGGELSVLYTPVSAALGLHAQMAGVSEHGADDPKMHADLELARRVAAAAGVPCEWIAIRDEPVAALLARGRCADLIVLGQRDPRAEGYTDAPDLPAEVVLGAGRPVLIVPFAGTFSAFGEHVVIAWNGTRESARAVADALPILAHAKSVLILSGAENKTAKTRIVAAATGVIRFLERHGVKAELHDLGRHRFDVGAKILAFCAERNADLLVMGAYGHSRARELVLGGVTQSLMEAMTVPVLMSH